MSSKEGLAIEVHGGGFRNLGAHLMTFAVLDALQKSDSSARVFMSPSTEHASAALADLPLLLDRPFPYPQARAGRLFRPRFAANRSVSVAMAPFTAGMKEPYVRYSESDALLDISGIRFGDAVTGAAQDSLIRLANFYHRRGKPVILLPQMLGPFRRKQSVRNFRRLMRSVDVVYARDSTSLGHALGVIPDAERIRLAPDITIFLEPSSGLPAREDEDTYGCLVPNARVLDRGVDAWKPIYLERLRLAGSRMAANDVTPMVLVHGTDPADIDLGRQLVDSLRPVVAELIVADRPLDAKALLAGAHIVVASRFHSAVSSLSTGVPTVVLGWAHKYETLVKDFDVGHLTHFATDSPHHLDELVDAVCERGERQLLSSRILAAKERMCRPNELMWADVLGRLGLEDNA